MNRRFAIFLAFVFATVGGVRAEDKPATPKPEKPATPKVEKPAIPRAEKPVTPKADKPKTEKAKVLIFEPPKGGPSVSPEPPAPKSPATPPAVFEGPAQIVRTFFGSLQDGKFDEAYGTLTKGSKIAEKPEELKQLKSKTREAVEVFGTIHGYDLVDSKAIGSRLVRSTYVSLGKVFPLRWRFYFYKPDDVWRLIDLRVDDKLTGIFDESEEAKASEAAPLQ